MSGITTRLVREGDALRLDGEKSWVLRAADPFSIHVLARAADGPASGPGSLVVVTVRHDARGVSLHEGRPQSVVPELPHASARFDGVAIEPVAVLAGDGYADHARPFRLVEDLCLAACALAWLLGEAGRYRWPDDWRQRAVAAVVMLRDAHARRSDDAAIEVLAAGALSLASGVVDGVDAASDGGGWPEASRARWQRDRVLLSGAGGVRAERARSAWRRLGDRT
jgi:alkylation response protein AidB-like acyl-CoA dehydrogenase